MNNAQLSLLCRIVAVALPLAALTSPATGQIRGSVVNGTSSGPQAGAEVHLVAHGQDNAVVGRAVTDDSGAFTLEAPADTAGMMLYLSTKHEGVEYAAPIGGAAHLMVYERTASDSTIRVTSHHIVVDANAREVTQIVVFRNTGNRTFATGEGHGHGIEIPLPVEVSALLKGDQGVHLHGNVLVDPRPAYPGNGQLAFGFAVPLSGDLAQLLPYPTDAVDVLVTPPDATLAAEAFQDLGETAFGNRSYRRYNLAGLSAGTRINLSLDGSGVVGWWRRSGLPIALAALALAMAAAAIYFGRMSRRQPAPVDPREQDLQTRRQALLMQVADLDDRHAEGEISDTDYESRRDALKAEVVRLTQALSTD